MPAVRCRIKRKDLGVPLSKSLKDLNGSVDRSAVRHEDLDARIILGKNAVYRLLDEFALVVRRHHGRDGGELLSRKVLDEIEFFGIRPIGKLFAKVVHTDECALRVIFVSQQTTLEH